MLPTGTPFIVVLDANVLYGYPLRDTLLRAVEIGLYQAVWSYEIWNEVLRNLKDPVQRTHPHTEAKAASLLATIEEHFPEGFVSGYEALIPTMTNDEKDRHVSALAVRAHAQVIVTYNLKHFPPASIAQYEVEAQHPDEFLMNLYGIDRLTMVQLVIDQAADLTRREMTPQELLDKMHRVGLKTFAHAIRQDLDPGGP
jgi:predicted nucleic acid-binding protein